MHVMQLSCRGCVHARKRVCEVETRKIERLSRQHDNPASPHRAETLLLANSATCPLLLTGMESCRLGPTFAISVIHCSLLGVAEHIVCLCMGTRAAAEAYAQGKVRALSNHGDWASLF